MFFDICHDKAVHYDFAWSAGVHVCRACKRRWVPVLPEVPAVWERYLEMRWVEVWSWTRLLHGRKRV